MSRGQLNPLSRGQVNPVSRGDPRSMAEQPVEQTIPHLIDTLGLTDHVIGFIGDTNVSRTYGISRRRWYRFYVLAFWEDVAAVEAWEWWTNGYDPDRSDIGGIALPWVPHCSGWPCYMCNSGPTYLQWRGVAYVDLYLHRYIKRLPSEARVQKLIADNILFRSRWICHDCSYIFECENNWPSVE